MERILPSLLLASLRGCSRVFPMLMTISVVDNPKCPFPASTVLVGCPRFFILSFIIIFELNKLIQPLFPFPLEKFYSSPWLRFKSVDELTRFFLPELRSRRLSVPSGLFRFLPKFSFRDATLFSLPRFGSRLFFPVAVFIRILTPRP